jgi:hypothetical protein
MVRGLGNEKNIGKAPGNEAEEEMLKHDIQELK